MVIDAREPSLLPLSPYCKPTQGRTLNIGKRYTRKIGDDVVARACRGARQSLSPVAIPQHGCLPALRRGAEGGTTRGGCAARCGDVSPEQSWLRSQHSMRQLHAEATHQHVYSTPHSALQTALPAMPVSVCCACRNNPPVFRQIRVIDAGFSFNYLYSLCFFIFNRC